MMKLKYIGFPIKDGCHKDGADKGIDKLKSIIHFDEIINIEEKPDDLDTVIHNDLRLASIVDKYQLEGFIPVTVGGDHSLAIGSIAGSASNNDIAVIWLDTHPDSNTNKTTVTFNLHGYPLAASMGFGQKELTNLYQEKTKVNYKDVVMFAIDDIDKPEEDLIDKYNIKNFKLDDIKSKTLDKCIEETIEYLKDKKVHISFDIDSIIYDDSPGVNVKNNYGRGISKEDALKAFKEFNEKLNVVSIDIVEYNPLNDIDDKSKNIVLDAINIINEIYK